MAAIDDLPPLRDVIARHGLDARKSLGQNFLLDLNLTSKIARAAGPLEGRTVIEVGPGPGGLTRALLSEGADRVIAIERDNRCLPALEEIVKRYPGRLRVIEGDALEFQPKEFDNAKVKIVANLPYNIGTRLLIDWISVEPWPPYYESLTLMFQREVAQRIIAEAGASAYGRLSVLAGWRCEARLLFDVPAQAFTPPPKVTSSIVQLHPRKKPLECELSALEMVTQAAFGKRRKMLRQSLKALGGETLLAQAGIDPQRRAETLSVEEFCTLASVISQVREARRS